ncbi:DUF418 domain-containing protein [soil metagenome]
MTTIDTTAAPAATRAVPVAVRDRIETLDILRGFAVLGILAVNAIAFAWPGTMDTGSATVPFSMEGANRVAIWVVDVFFHNKCRTLFSMLFGVSIFLVGGERSDRARGALLRRRLFFLAMFGLIHGLALWFGDILLLYAWAGVFMMLARSWTSKRLLWVGAALVIAFSLLMIAGEGVGVILSPVSDPAEFAEAVAKGQAATLATVETVRSGWGAAMFENLKTWAMIQGMSVVLFVFPTVGLMMLGLGLFKSGYLAGRSSSWSYARALILGLAITVVFGVTEWLVLDPAPAPKPTLLADIVLDSLAPFVTLAWVALLILMTRHGFGVLTRRLAPAGRMAFTNYLTQTIIMASIFYMPWGPHLYGHVEPAGLWAIVAAIWLLQLIWSPLWLSRFEMGPLEWVWRCLTYGRRVPLLKQA